MAEITFGGLDTMSGSEGGGGFSLSGLRSQAGPGPSIIREDQILLGWSPPPPTECVAMRERHLDAGRYLMSRNTSDAQKQLIN